MPVTDKVSPFVLSGALLDRLREEQQKVQQEA